MQERRSALGICTYDGKIFACGGYNGSNMLSSCEYYQPMTNEWKSLPNMNKARSAVAVTVFENHVWVLGGHDGLTIFNSVEKYDHESNRWCMETSMLSKRCRHGAASMKGKLYVFGGYDGREFLTSCEVMVLCSNNDILMLKIKNLLLSFHNAIIFENASLNE